MNLMKNLGVSMYRKVLSVKGKNRTVNYYKNILMNQEGNSKCTKTIIMNKISTLKIMNPNAKIQEIASSVTEMKKKKNQMRMIRITKS